MNNNPRVGDAARIDRIRLVDHAPPAEWCNTCFLLRLLDARGAALRECQTEIEMLREALSVIAGGDGDPQVIAEQTLSTTLAEYRRIMESTP